VNNAITTYPDFEANLAGDGWYCISAAPVNTLPFAQPSWNGNRFAIQTQQWQLSALHHGPHNLAAPPNLFRFTIEFAIGALRVTHNAVDCNLQPIP